jgi:hypothetical protein
MSLEQYLMGHFHSPGGNVQPMIYKCIVIASEENNSSNSVAEEMRLTIDEIVNLMRAHSESRYSYSEIDEGEIELFDGKSVLFIKTAPLALKSAIKMFKLSFDRPIVGEYHGTQI